MQIIQKILNRNKINTILHDCMINLRGDAGAHKTSLTRSFFIEMPVPSKESEQSHICVLGFRFSLRFYDSWNCFVFRFIILLFKSLLINLDQYVKNGRSTVSEATHFIFIH